MANRLNKGQKPNSPSIEMTNIPKRLDPNSVKEPLVKAPLEGQGLLDEYVKSFEKNEKNNRDRRKKVQLGSAIAGFGHYLLFAAFSSNEMLASMLIFFVVFLIAFTLATFGFFNKKADIYKDMSTNNVRDLINHINNNKSEFHNNWQQMKEELAEVLNEKRNMDNQNNWQNRKNENRNMGAYVPAQNVNTPKDQTSPSKDQTFTSKNQTFTSKNQESTSLRR